jgi:xylulose-5-phosphate/fructose-6-phosphate phosphoketolase
MTVDLTDRDLGALTDEELASLDAWWRARNYLTIGQIYLKDNALLRRPLSVDDIKPRLLGHWDQPGLSFIYAHMSRLIGLTGQQAIYLTGPGHGGPALVAASWLEGHTARSIPGSAGTVRASTGCSAALQPGRNSQSRLCHHPRLDP